MLFPYPNLTFPAQRMLRSKWASNLKSTVDMANFNKQITYLMVSFDYFSTLINWLLHAKLHAPSIIRHLLVVCLDEQSHKVLSDKGIISSIVTVNDIIKSLSDIEGTLFHARVVVRLTVLRLLNYWGYDVLQMDIDALLMNDIQPVFDHFNDVDIITSASMKNCIPKIAHRAWGFCMCIGAVLIRGNDNTGMYVYVCGVCVVCSYVVSVCVVYVSLCACSCVPFGVAISLGKRALLTLLKAIDLYKCLVSTGEATHSSIGTRGNNSKCQLSIFHKVGKDPGGTLCAHTFT